MEFGVTGAVLLLHRFCLHTHWSAVCRRFGAGSGLLLRGKDNLGKYEHMHFNTRCPTIRSYFRGLWIKPLRLKGPLKMLKPKGFLYDGDII